MRLNLILSDKKFRSFFWTQFLGAFNDNFFKNALVVLVAFRGVDLLGLDTNSLVAIAGGIFILPFFLFSPLAGQLADKFQKSTIVRVTKLSEVLIMLVAGFGFLTQSYVLLFGVLFLMGSQSAFFGPVKYSLIPDLVKEDDLTEGNAYLELGTFIAILLGTILGGVSTTIERADIWIGTALILVAALGYLVSRGIPSTPISAKNLSIQKNPFPQYLELFKIIKEKPVILNSVLGISWFWFFGAGILSVLPIYCKDYLKGDEQIVTLFLSVFTFGIGVGSILCEKLSFKRVEIGLVPVGSIGMTIFLVDLYFVKPNFGHHDTLGMSEFLSHGDSFRLLIDFFFMSVFGGIFIVPLYTLLQERSAAKVRSRVISGNNIFNAIFMVCSSLFVMLFYKQSLDTAQIFLVFAIMNLVVAFYIYSIVPEFTLRFYAWVLSRILYRVDIKGLENIPKKGPVVLAGNHVTFVDWLILSGACKRPARFVMYYKFFKIPIVRTLFKQAKVIPIAGAREDLSIMKKAFELISKELKKDQVICIFPEGKLTSDGKLSNFRPGITKIIENDLAVVVPFVLKGFWNSAFSHGRQGLFSQGFRRPVTIEFLQSISGSDFALEKLEYVVANELNERPPSKRNSDQPE